MDSPATEGDAKPQETEGNGDGVDFLFRAMYDRDPKKRRVKPVERHLIQLDFGLSDSEEDSDFEIKDHQDHDDSGGSNDEGDDDDDGSSGGSGSEDDEDDENESDVSESELHGEMSVGEMIARANEKTFDSKSRPSDKIKMLICAVCLGEVSEDSDEIVECDECGIAVHEGCYGDFNSSGCYGEIVVSDTDSTSSAQTASSTEPWFCDSCKAGVTSPTCELCPNLGGIFKETDAGRWVHIVCALYVPGVAFGDVTKLRWVTLSEMQQNKWGARMCSYCEDDRFSKTGVCVPCDAGMCRNYFHVTCGQREGLLSEASLDEEIADPFYAYCKLHADKAIVRRKRQNWLAVQSRIKQEKNEDDPLALNRIKQKLKQCQKKYNETRAKKPPAWVPSGADKVARMLTTSASACRRLMRKAELLGYSTESIHHAPSKASGDATRRKHHAAPAFSADFINYYLDRDIKMTNLKHKLDELMTNNERLTQEEKACREKYDQLNSEVESSRMTNGKERCVGENLWKILCGITGNKLPLPEPLQPPKVKKEPPKAGGKGSVIHQCGICDDSNDQHMLVQCDICQKHYHLGCLDPPLTRMPKKTAFSGWQCSECMSDSSDSSDAANDAAEEDNKEEGNRRKKRVIREPNKFTPQHEVRKKTFKGKRKYTKRKRPAGKDQQQEPKGDGSAKDGEMATNPVMAVVTLDDDEDSPEVLTVKRPRKTYTPKPKPQDVRTECISCKTTGNNKNLVRCDGCKRCYHFGCLDPPCKSTPKIRGYQWYCTDCDSNSDDSDDVISVEEMDVEEIKEIPVTQPSAPPSALPSSAKKGTTEKNGSSVKKPSKSTPNKSTPKSTPKANQKSTPKTNQKSTPKTSQKSTPKTNGEKSGKSKLSGKVKSAGQKSAEKNKKSSLKSAEKGKNSPKPQEKGKNGQKSKSSLKSTNTSPKSDKSSPKTGKNKSKTPTSISKPETSGDNDTDTLEAILLD